MENNEILSNSPDHNLESISLSESISDGILDPERFEKAKFKILWVLKEPYDSFDEDGNPAGGGWHFKDALLPKEKIEDFDKGSRNTFVPIIYASYSLLNGFPSSTEMPLLESQPSMLEALKSIAYINLKKTPGYTQTPENILSVAYSENKDLLHKQIEEISPDILIFGNTFRYFQEDFGITSQELTPHDNARFVCKNGRIYIDTYHPAQRLYSKWDYVNEIVEICERHNLTKKE